MNVNTKGSRDLRNVKNFRKTRSRKRKNVYNPKTVETDESSFSTSAKKIKTLNEIIVPEDSKFEYRILNFITVFAAISTFVKCKECGDNIKFETAQTRGLGFKIAVLCKNCAPQYVPSSPFIGHSYEINRRFIFVMRLLGIGLRGCKKFCGLMDMPPFLAQGTYDIIIEQMHGCVKTVAEKLFSKAVKEEIAETCKKQNVENTLELTVSGDGTWKKRGFTSLYGVSSLIGYYSGKILDLVVKSAYCKACEFWAKKTNTVEYEEWAEAHKSECSANHSGSSGKMEVDSIVQMFQQSEQKYKVKYKNYIGDGDSKTYTGILNAAPYGETLVDKKECIGHVQKRMGTRLRDVKKKSTGTIVDEKTGKKKRASLGGKGKLTDKMIDKLTVYYGLAIRRNCDSAEKMREAIWATYYHYGSTKENPQHEKCPPGAESWCSWQRYSAEGKLDSYELDYNPLPQDVLNAIKPVYEDLSKDTLLNRCVGGFTQNNNESYNQLIWKISPKIIPSGSSIVEIAAYIAACTFNEGTEALLSILHAMGVSLGRYAHLYAQGEDKERVHIAEKRAHENTREGRMHHRQHQIDILEATSAAEGLLYGPGIDDSV